MINETKYILSFLASTAIFTYITHNSQCRWCRRQYTVC